jgi:acyl carrier protein
LIGSQGQIDYCAANAFLDAFAHYNRTQRAIPTFSINWGAWQWDAWQSSLLASLPEVYEQVKQIRQKYGITFAEGEETLWRILSTTLPQVAISTLDWQAGSAQWDLLTSSDFLKKIRQRSNRLVYPRPNLRNPYLPPRDDKEEKIAEIWQDALAIEKVGIHDHFLELGGDSLLGMMIISEVNKKFNLHLSAAALYERPTVSELYKMIWPGQDEQKSSAAISERGKKRKKLRQRRKKQKA